jgi:hypothetical protein
MTGPRVLKADERRALNLLADAGPNGLTEHVLLVHCFCPTWWAMVSQSQHPRTCGRVDDLLTSPA